MTDPAPADPDVDKATVVRATLVPAARAGRLPVLIVMRGDQAGRRFPVNEDSLVIGRNPERAQFVITGDAQVSSVHCRIDRGPANDCWLLVDLSSTNGTVLRGKRITTAALSDGDRVHLGDTVLKFCLQDESAEGFA